MGDVETVVVGAVALAGSLLVLLAGIGVLRFRDVYTRMHAATKVSTLGIALVGLAAAIGLDGGRAKILIAVAFTFVTAPSAAHLVGRAAHRAEGIDIELDVGDELAEVIDAAEPDGSPG